MPIGHKWVLNYVSFFVLVQYSHVTALVHCALLCTYTDVTKHFPLMSSIGTGQFIGYLCVMSTLYPKHDA